MIELAELVELAGLNDAFATLYFAELWEADHELFEQRPEGLGAEVTELLTIAPAFLAGAVQARVTADELTLSLVSVFDRVEVLAMPTLPILPPRLDDPDAGHVRDGD